LFLLPAAVFERAAENKNETASEVDTSKPFQRFHSPALTNLPEKFTRKKFDRFCPQFPGENRCFGELLHRCHDDAAELIFLILQLRRVQ
jgi:hypothetical protein